MQERQKYLDLLDARMQSSKARVSLLRQIRQLDWIHSEAKVSVSPWRKATGKPKNSKDIRPAAKGPTGISFSESQ
jgi:hypothetical protein